MMYFTWREKVVSLLLIEEPKCIHELFKIAENITNHPSSQLQLTYISNLPAFIVRNDTDLKCIFNKQNATKPKEESIFEFQIDRLPLKSIRRRRHASLSQRMERMAKSIKEIHDKIDYKVSKNADLALLNFQTVHEGVTCKCCNAKNIVGRRYVCIECKDFNLCESCENIGHPHPMLRLLNSADKVTPNKAGKFNSSVSNNFPRNNTSSSAGWEVDKTTNKKINSIKIEID